MYDLTPREPQVSSPLSQQGSESPGPWEQVFAQDGEFVSPQRLNSELFVIPIETAFLVYAPLRRAAFLCNAAVVEQIAQLSSFGIVCDGESTDLVRLLQRLDILDGAPEVVPDTTCSGPPTPTKATLLLTTACNLRCAYCYASSGLGREQAMSLPVAKRVVDFICDNAVATDSPEIELGFHGGGEPTMNWATLVAAHEYATARAAEFGLKLRSSTATNGVLSDKKIDWIISHLDGVSLSCDGLPEVHDKNRVTASGEGSSHAVYHTIERFGQSQFPFGLRMTVTQEHVDRLADSLAYLCSRFRPNAIQIEPVYACGRWKGKSSAATEAFIDAYRSAQAIARDYGLEVYFSAARLGILTNHFCGATQDNFCVTADGTVSACHEVFRRECDSSRRFFYSQLDHETGRFLFDMENLDRLRQFTVDNREYCEGCFAKWTCAGDCPHKVASSLSGTSCGTDRCHITRELTKDQILDRIEISGGLFWREPPEPSATAEVAKGCY